MLRIEALGGSTQEKNEKRGKLFEKLCRDLLCSLGYEIRSVTRANYAGMEIDIEGEKIIEKTSFIGECKAHSNDISSEKLQKFVGKLHPKWLKNETTKGIFIVLPKLNPHARAYYNDNYKDLKNFILRVLEEEDILKNIFDSHLCIAKDELNRIVSRNFSFQLGDCELIYTKDGFFWFQLLIDPKEDMPNNLCVLNNEGNIIDESYFTKNLKDLSDDFSELRFLSSKTEEAKIHWEKIESDEIVEIHGSSEWFEYQFPASPAYFVGRQSIVSDFLALIDSIVNSKTAYRSIVINGNSGWGKSSCILKLADVAKENTLIIPIDTRTASSTRFLLCAVKHVFNKIIKAEFPEVEEDNFHIGGSESLFENLDRLDEVLKKNRKIVVIFFDQFENIFYQSNILEKFRDFALKLNDKQYNIIVGFSWKIDLVGITHDFPYTLRDDISKESKIFQVQKFGELETQAIINALGEEIGAQIRKDLTFRLSEFSQGLPWLLKKLCAHIIKQRQKGISQVELANKLLNVRELFDADISELSTREHETLKYIAQKAPISINEIGEVYDKNLISFLINKRLIVQVGPKYDIYWDIFRDYLNTGKLPAEETYILRAAPNSLLSLFKEFLGKSKISVQNLIKKEIYTEKTVYNILKDAKLLDLVEIKEDEVKPLFNTRISEQQLPEEIKHLIKEKLGKHKIVDKISKLFLETEIIRIEQIIDIFREVFPYIKADQKTWDTYARILGRWIDFADYGIYGRDTVRKFNPKSDVKSIYTFAPRYGRPDFFIPQTQYGPIEELMKKIECSIKNTTPIDVSSSRMRKALATAVVGIKFVEIRQNKIRLTQLGISFIKSKERRSEIFKNAALKIEMFKEFMELLKNLKRRDIASLSKGLNKVYGNRWKYETAKGITKILINWAKHAGIIERERKKQDNSKQLRIF